ncbi:MAG: AI-2E family transporter [Actinocatenispora sp.]
MFRRRASRAWQIARGRLEDDQRPGVWVVPKEPAPPSGETSGEKRDEPAPGAPAASSTAGADTAERSVPRPVRVAAAWSWRMVAIGAAVVAVFYGLSFVSNVVIPAIIALLLSAMLQPGAHWLHRHGVPRSLAALIMLITGIVVVAGVLTGVITSFVNGYSDLAENVVAGLRQIQEWLHNGPLHFSDKQINNALTTAQDWVSDHQSDLTSGAVSTATTLGEVAVDLFLILFTTFFLVRDGRVIWNFLLQLFLPRAARPAVNDAGTASWRTLVAYVRATVLVAFIDAVCIGIGIVAVGVDYSLAIPLAALVFLGAFIPIVGATVSGVVAVLVTLVTQGLLGAIVVLVVVLGVQQIEGHLLQPLIMGRAVQIHPLGVILGITSGIAIAGIFGGLIAVPLIAVLNIGVRRLVAWQRHNGDVRSDADSGDDAALPPPQSVTEEGPEGTGRPATT